MGKVRKYGTSYSCRALVNKILSKLLFCNILLYNNIAMNSLDNK